MFNSLAILRRFSTPSTTQLPYFVERTAVGRNLPVYTDFRNGTQIYTIIRKIHGDPEALANDLLKEHIKNDKKMMREREKKWKIRRDLGQVWISGKWVSQVRKFLAEKGF